MSTHIPYANVKITHLTIIPSNIRIRHNLRDHSSQPQLPKHSVAVRVELEVMAQGHGECGSFFWSGHGKKLGYFERGLAFCARVVAEDGV